MFVAGIGAYNHRLFVVHCAQLCKTKGLGAILSGIKDFGKEFFLCFLESRSLSSFFFFFFFYKIIKDMHSSRQKEMQQHVEL